MCVTPERDGPHGHRKWADNPLIGYRRAPERYSGESIALEVKARTVCQAFRAGEQQCATNILFLKEHVGFSLDHQRPRILASTSREQDNFLECQPGHKVHTMNIYRTASFSACFGPWKPSAAKVSLPEGSGLRSEGAQESLSQGKRRERNLIPLYPEWKRATYLRGPGGDTPIHHVLHSGHVAHQQRQCL